MRELGGRLAGLSLGRQVAVLAIWPFFEQVLNLSVGLVDLALAGRIGTQESFTKAAVDALGVTSFIGWLMGVILGSVGIGSTAVIARAVGGRHRRLASAALGQSVTLSLIVGTLAGAVIFALATPIGLLINRHGLSLHYIEVYLQITMLGAPAMALLFVGNACLRGGGDTRTPFFVMLLVNAVNVVASVLLTFGPEPWGGHGVAGIAGGTLIAWWVGGIAIVAVLLRGNGTLRLRPARMRPHAEVLRRIVRVGVPSLMERLGGTWLATFIVLIIVGQLTGPGGESAGLVGAHMIAIRIEAISFQPGFALGTAAATLAGQYLGLGDHDRARRAIALSWGAACLLMGLMGVVFILVPREMCQILTHSPSLLDLASPLVRICGFVQVFFATYMVLSSAFAGVGDTRTTMLLTYASAFLIRVPGAWIMGVWLGWGLVGVWLALCGDLVVKGLLFAGRYVHGGWQRVEV